MDLIEKSMSRLPPRHFTWSLLKIFVKSMPPSLSELKVIPSFCFAFKILDDVTATSTEVCLTFSSYLNISKFNSQRRSLFILLMLFSIGYFVNEFITIV